MANTVPADGDAQVEQPVEAAPAASGNVEGAAPEAPVGGTSTTLTAFPFQNEDLLCVQASRLQDANLGKAELSAELFAQCSLLELKSEAARWHSASDQVEKDLGTLGPSFRIFRVRRPRRARTKIILWSKTAHSQAGA